MAPTDIEWADQVWNPVRGCALVSAGCRRCYAMKQAHRFSGPGKAYEGLTELGPNGPRWTGRARTVEGKLLEPLSWRKPARVFVNSMSDLFHEDVPFEFIDRVFAVMALAPRHTFLVLTKRPDRMRAYLAAGQYRDAKVADAAKATFKLVTPFALPSTEVFDGRAVARCEPWSIHAWPLKNVHLGVSVENQQTADERIPHLLQTPAAVRWVSYEPALGPIDFTRIAAGPLCPQRPSHRVDVLRAGTWDMRSGFVAAGKPDFINHSDMERLDGIVMGGESGAGAEPMHPVWAQRTRNQCAEAGVAFFFKQWGAWQHGSLVTRKGEDHPVEFKGEIVLSDGQHARLAEDFDGSTKARWHELHATMMARVGKKTAGRLLDGRTHDELPEARA